MMINYGKIWIMILVLAIATLAAYASLAIPPSRAAGPWYVGPGGSDGNNCTSPATRCATINGALGKAGFVAGDTILVQLGTYTGTGNEVVLLDKDVTLSGGWDAGFTTQTGMSTIDGESSRRGITVNSGVTATIERFVVQDGSVSSGGGGGICNSGTLTLNNTTISDNIATTSVNSSDCNQASNGGGIYNTNTGTLTLNDSIVSGNNVDCNGSGVYNEGNFTSKGSIIRENTTGGMFCVGTAVMNISVMTLNSTVVSDNEPGGGIFNNNGTLILNSSTISGNTSDDWNGGGITNWPGTNGTTTLNNSTISGNGTTGDGGGFLNGGSGTVTSQNTIFANNTASGNGPDCNGTISSSGYNLVGDISDCTFASTTGDLTNIDPKLGPLQDNGGPTETHALLSGSPAIDAGNPAGCTDHLGTPLTTDQRGFPRVNRCDIGAYEFDQSSSPSPNLVYLPIIFFSCPSRYFDDYSDPGSGWSFVDSGDVRLEYLAGEYRILLRNQNWWAWARPFSNNTPDFKATNYSVSADVRNDTGVFGGPGLAFGISDNGSQFYTFEVFPNGTFEIWRFSQFTRVAQLASGSSGSINTGTANNNLRIERTGSQIKAYANNQLLATVSDGSFVGLRQVGVFASSFNQPNVDGRFDNFSACNLGGVSSTGTSQTLNSGEEAIEIELSGGWVNGPDQR